MKLKLENGTKSYETNMF